MKKRPLEIFGIIIAAVLLVLLGFFIFKNQATAPTENEANQASGTSIKSNNNQLANPASVNCENLGGTITIKERGDGGQYGICEFGEGMACEEWALYNQNCPAGGVDISGLDSEIQMYCLWLGGELDDVNLNTCTLPDENVCNTDELYNGVCPTQ